LEPRIGNNPMRHVQKVQTNGGEHIKRRALRADELARLISVSGPRGVVYRIAARTGIRRGELEQIEWRDVHLEAAQPFLQCVRQSQRTTRMRCNR
jgi:integrase